MAVRIGGEPGAELVDWRIQPRHLLDVAPCHLPDRVRAGCLDYMARTGLAFACFDFIVAPSGEHHFLEANQMGQFLWIEEKLPDVPMLDIMCRFLASGDRGFRWRPPARPLELARYLDSVRPREGAAAAAS